MTHPRLVVIFLRGGCDGLALVSPASDPDFIAVKAGEKFNLVRREKIK